MCMRFMLSKQMFRVKWTFGYWKKKKMFVGAKQKRNRVHRIGFLYVDVCICWVHKEFCLFLCTLGRRINNEMTANTRLRLLTHRIIESVNLPAKIEQQIYSGKINAEINQIWMINIPRRRFFFPSFSLSLSVSVSNVPFHRSEWR